MYENKAEKLAVDVCHHFAVSGARAFMDEAKSEAKIALWRQAKNYDPSKQMMQRIVSEDAYWAALLGHETPKVRYKDPYDTFWISSIQRVRGAVIDFFRSQKLITKLPKAQDGAAQVRTMLYYERFVSINRPVTDDIEGTSMDTWADKLQSRDRADAGDHMHDVRTKLSWIMEDAELDDVEKRVIELIYSEHEHSTSAVAGMLGMPEAKVKRVRDEALLKLRASAASVAQTIA